MRSSTTPAPPPSPAPPTGGPPSTGRSDLRGIVMNGLLWKIISLVVKQGSRLIVGLILARLLTPDDYGLASLVLVFSSLIFIFSDLSLGAALVQRKSLTERDRSTVFWVSVAAGAACTLVGIAVSGLVADFFGEPEVKPLFIAVSFSFFLVSLGVTQEALLTRAMSFRALELRQMAAAVLGAAAAITVAARGGGPWAIIVQQIVIVAVGSLLMWFVSPWRPRFTFSMASLRDLGSFGGNVFGTRMVFYLNRNADNLLIGRFLGAAALGAYSLAYNVILLPFSQIAGPLEQLLYPAFSRLQDEASRLREAFLRVNRMVCAINMPLLLGLAVLADQFVPVVLGEQWNEAIPVIQILAVVGLAQSIQALNGSILQARDRTHWLLRYSLVFTAVTVAAFAVGVSYGIVGVAWSLAVASCFLEPLYAVITARALDMPVRDIARNLWGPTQASLLMLVAVVGARLGAESAGGGDALQLLAGVAAGVIVYPPLLWWRAPAAREDILGIIRRRRGQGAPVAEA
jgi:O-antigen/teichoic acid export membrane protein